MEQWQYKALFGFPFGYDFRKLNIAKLVYTSSHLIC